MILKLLKKSVLFLLLLSSLSLSAQQLEVQGVVRNLLTEHGVDSAEVVLLGVDKVEKARTMAEVQMSILERNPAGWMRYGKNPMDGAEFSLKAPAPGKYILRCSHPKFETNETEIDIPAPTGKKAKAFVVDDIYLSPEGQLLGEAQVTGTRIKMFYKGDTLVYNAAAFMLPEGSMLKKLVEQLPGAELRDGNIYVNGRLVENLLLGGKNFFNGNPQAALNNLPAYVVNRIKVYEQDGENSKSAGSDMGDRQYVMDVHLKRQYIGTSLGKLNAGYGTSDRYEAGLFLMRFDERKSFTFTSDLNNLNRATEYTDMGDMADVYNNGRRERQQAAASYRFEPNGRVRFMAHGELDLRQSRLINEETTEQFLPSGNLYGRAASSDWNRELKLSGNTSLTLRPKKGRVAELSYDVSHRHTDANAARRSITLDADRFHNVTTIAALDSVFSLRPTEAQRLGVLNRLRTAGTSENTATKHSASIRANMAVATNDLLAFVGIFSHESNTREAFDLYDLQYPATPAAADFRRRYRPEDKRAYSYELQTTYYRKYVKRDDFEARLEPSYRFKQNYNALEAPLYRLDALGDEFGVDGAADLTLLPSTAEALAQTLFSDETVFSTQRNRSHELSLAWAVDRCLRDSSWMFFTATMKMAREEKRLSYHRAGQFFPVARNNWAPGPSLSLQYHPVKGDRHGSVMLWKLTLNYSERMPNGLEILVPIVDNTDPLNVHLGNPALKNARVYYANLLFRRTWKKRGSNLSMYSYFYQTDRAAALQETYNRETGVRTSKVVNVNGNRLFSGNATFTLPIDSLQRYVLTLGFQPTYEQSVDLAGVSTANTSTAVTTSEKSLVRTLSLTPNLSLQWRPSKIFAARMQMKAAWCTANGTRADFVRINATDCSVALGIDATLPAALQFSTKLNLVKRFGCNDAEMRKVRLRCDASLTREFGNFYLKFSAADLFASDRNTLYFLNKQGSTEQIMNVLPRYVLLTASWRFNKVGKKK